MGEYDRLVQGTATPAPSGFYIIRQGEEIVTHIAAMRYIMADSVINFMHQTFWHNVVMLPIGNGREILLQGRATDVSRVLEIIRSIDVPRS